MNKVKHKKCEITRSTATYLYSKHLGAGGGEEAEWSLRVPDNPVYQIQDSHGYLL
jgi:hypothetical protein